MKHLGALFTLFIWWSLVAFTRVAAGSPAVAFSELSPCALNCLLTWVPLDECNLTDFDCQCHSQKLVDDTFGCMLANCTVQDLVDLGRARETFCVIPNDTTRAPKLLIVGSVLTSITVLLVATKIIGRLSIDKRLFTEEWLVVAASIVAVTGFSLIVWLSKNGYGKHTYYMDSPQIAQVFKRFYACETLYLLGVMLAKASILRLYLTLFPGKTTRLVTQISLFLVVLSSSVLIFIQIAQCRPLNRAWNKDAPGTCIDLNRLAVASSGVNIGQDALILLIPIPMLTKLEIHPKQKLGMLFLFGLYSFALVTSIIRIQFVKNLGRYLVDPAYDDAPGTLWSVIDINISIICACLPSLPGCIRRLWACTCYRTNNDSYSLHSSIRSRPALPSLRIPNCDDDDGNRTVDTRWSQTTFAQSQLTTPSSASTTKRLGSEVKFGNETKCYSAYSANQSEPIRWSLEDPERDPKRQLSWDGAIAEERESECGWPLKSKTGSSV